MLTITKCDLIFKILWKHDLREWNEECQVTFDKVKEYLSNASMLVPPILGKSLILYLTLHERSIGCVLEEHDETECKERGIYYLRKKFTDMSQSIHYWRKCVAHSLGQLRGSYSTCYIILLGS